MQASDLDSLFSSTRDHHHLGHLPLHDHHHGHVHHLLHPDQPLSPTLAELLCSPNGFFASSSGSNIGHSAGEDATSCDWTRPEPRSSLVVAIHICGAA